MSPAYTGDPAFHIGDAVFKSVEPLELEPDEVVDYCPSCIEPVTITVELTEDQSEDFLWMARHAWAASLAKYPESLFGPVVTRKNTRSVAGVGTFRGHFVGRDICENHVLSGDLHDIVPYPCEATASVETIGDLP